MILRPYREEDIAPTLAWLNDKALMRYSSQRSKTHTVESQREYWKSFVYPNHYLAIENGSLVGTATIYVEDGRADIGTLIGVPGHGYGSEVFGHLIAIAFSIPGVRKVTGGTLDGNVAMWKVYEKHGMKLEATLREHEIHDGEAHDVRIYGLLRYEWAAR